MGRKDALYCTLRDDEKYIFYWHVVGGPTTEYNEIIVDYINDEHGMSVDTDLCLLDAVTAKGMVERVIEMMPYECAVRIGTERAVEKKLYPLDHFNDLQTALTAKFGRVGEPTRYKLPFELRVWADAEAGVITKKGASSACAAMLAQVACVATQYGLSLRDVAMSVASTYVDGDVAFELLNKLDRMNDGMHVYRQALDALSELERRALYEQRPVELHRDDRGRPYITYAESEEGRRDAQMAAEQRALLANTEFWGNVEVGPSPDVVVDVRGAYGLEWKQAEGGYVLTDEALRELRERPTNPYLAELDKYADWGKGTDETVVTTFLYGSHVMGYENGNRLCAACVTDIGLVFSPEDGSNVGAAKCDRCQHNEYNQSATP